MQNFGGNKKYLLKILAKQKGMVLNTFYCYLGYLFTSTL